MVKLQQEGDKLTGKLRINSSCSRFAAVAAGGCSQTDSRSLPRSDCLALQLALARVAAIRATRVIRLPRPYWHLATDRFSITKTGGFDPELTFEAQFDRPNTGNSVRERVTGSCRCRAEFSHQLDELCRNTVRKGRPSRAAPLTLTPGWRLRCRRSSPACPTVRWLGRQ